MLDCPVEYNSLYLLSKPILYRPAFTTTHVRPSDRSSDSIISYEWILYTHTLSFTYDKYDKSPQGSFRCRQIEGTYRRNAETILSVLATLSPLSHAVRDLTSLIPINPTVSRARLRA